MLKVNRLVESVPQGLRADRLSEYRAEMRAHFSLPPEERHYRRAPYKANVILDDPELRAALHKVFAGKCAYCELKLVHTWGDIAHLRPVSNAASTDDEKSSPDHYAWLAYEWRNLLLLCSECNRMKRNLFPVAGPRALPLTTWREAVAAEEALLLDPCSDDPVRHLAFTHTGEMHALTGRGAMTLKQLGLNRPQLQELRRDVFGDLYYMSNRPTKHEMDDLLDPRRPHAGALKIFAIGLCKIVARKKRIKLPVDSKNLAWSLISARELLSDGEWTEAIGRVGPPDPRTSILKTLTPVAEFQELRQSRREQPFLESIHIEHFKGIDDIKLFMMAKRRGKSSGAPSAVLLGENAVGKSSILQAVALTLMDKKDRDALGLQPEDFISRDQGSWHLTTSTMPSITLRFAGGMQSVLRYDENHVFDIENDFPCTILAYGSRRFFVESGAKRQGSHLNKTLFDPQATLQDPGIWLREINPHKFAAVARAMRMVLALRDDDAILRTDDGNVLVRAHGRETPVERMSDGYRSLFAMAIDIMRNMLDTWDNLEYARGIVLIDELETHLHPRWKMQVMSALRKAMPQVQFIATTHDPLCLRGMKNGEAHVVYRDNDGQVRLAKDLPDIETLRAEQILTSDYFGLWTTADFEQETVLIRLAELGGSTEQDLSARERRERDKLLSQFEGMPVIGSSPDRQILAEAMTRHLRNQSAPIGERAALREDAIDEIVAVLERAMRS